MKARIEGWRWFGAPLLALSFVLSGCALPVRNDVTVFHDWPAGLSERTFRLRPDLARAGDLEYRTYRRIVRDELLAAGFSESPNPALEIGFQYQFESVKTQVIEQAPVVYSSFHFGHHWSHGGLSLGFPLFFGGSSIRNQYDVLTFRRELTLEIYDRRFGEPVRIYQASAANRGSSPARVEALPYLMRAVLADFPGRSGVARRVDLEPPPAQASAKADAAPTPSQ